MDLAQQKNHPLWIVDDILVACGLVLFLFSLYIAPYIFFNAAYPVPDFIHRFSSWWSDYYGLEGSALKAAIFLSFFAPSIILFITSWIVTYFLEKAESAATRTSQDE